jgi:hypothetical protein
MEGHLRALLRDVLCGYLDADLKAVADEILIETHGEPLGEIEARDMREEAVWEPESPTSHPGRFEREEEEEPVTFEPDLEWEDEEYDTAEMEPVAVAQEPAHDEPAHDEPAHDEPVQYELDGVTQSADWGWDEPEDYSAPV